MGLEQWGELERGGLGMGEFGGRVVIAFCGWWWVRDGCFGVEA